MGKVPQKRYTNRHLRGRTTYVKSKDLVPGGKNKVKHVRNPSSRTVAQKSTTSLPVQPSFPLDVVDDPQPSPSQPETPDTPYVHQRKREYNSWGSVRDSVRDTSMKLESPISETCSRWSRSDAVKRCEKPAAFRCRECGPMAVFCLDCLKKEHVDSFHIPEEWKDNFFQPYVLSSMMQLPHHEHCKCDRYFKPVRVFDSAGRIQHRELAFCSCEPANCTLLKYGLWGATAAEPKTAFSTTLLEWLVLLNLESQLSVLSFCRTLRIKNGLSLSQMDTLYRALIGQSIAEFRHLMYRQRSMTDLCQSLDDGTICPACPKENGTQIISLDGNFGLVRKKSAGCSIAPPLRGQSFFVADEDVKTFMASYRDKSAPDEDCSNFKAGNYIRSSSKQTKLDVTGIFGSVCRHEIPRLFLNMAHGERLGYPVYLIKLLLEDLDAKNVKLNVIYDISCVLESHLKKTADGKSILDRLSVALDVFHSYGHRSACQIKYSTRRLQGFGLTDGESVERLWAYLRKFSSITKEMTPSSRIDLLTDALLHYSLWKTIDIDVALVRKMEKAIQTVRIAEEEISAIMNDANVSKSEIEKWSIQEREAITKEKFPTRTVRKWKRDYVVKLLQLGALRKKLAASQKEDESLYLSAFQQLDEQLTKEERDHDITQRWNESSDDFTNTMKKVDWNVRSSLLSKMQRIANERSFLISLKRKYHDGQSIASKLSKQLNTSNRKLQKALDAYNAVEWKPRTSTLPPKPEFREVTDPAWVGYSCLDPSVMEASSVPRSVQRKAIDSLHLLERAKEDIAMIKQEMKCVFKHYETQHDLTDRSIADVGGKDDPMSVGKHAVLKKHMKSLEARMKILYGHFSEHVPDLPIQLSGSLVLFPLLDANLDILSEYDFVSEDESDDEV